MRVMRKTALLLLVSPERMGVAHVYILSPQEAVAELSQDCQESKACLGYIVRLKKAKKGKGRGCKKSRQRALAQGWAQVPSLRVSCAGLGTRDA